MMFTAINAVIRVFLIATLALDMFLLIPEIHDLFERQAHLASSQKRQALKWLIAECISVAAIVIINVIAVAADHHLFDHQFSSMLVLIALAAVAFTLHRFVFCEAGNKISDLYHPATNSSTQPDKSVTLNQMTTDELLRKRDMH